MITSGLGSALFKVESFPPVTTKTSPEPEEIEAVGTAEVRALG